MTNTSEQTVIIGAGIGGLTAAIYTARAHLSPVIFCGPEDGGQLTYTTEVENFPGFPQGVLGPQLVADAKTQAQKFGARFISQSVQNITKTPTGFLLTIDDQSTVETQTIIYATGASARWLNIPSETQYKGRGVHTCATCDGFFYKKKHVFVIGGGDSAMEEASYLAKMCASVTIVHRKDSFRASKPMQDRIFANPVIKIIWNSEITQVIGDGTRLTSVELTNTQTQQKTVHTIDGVFLAIGHIPNSALVAEFVDRNETGYILATDQKTKTPGLFVCGDVSDFKYRQAITAAGSGCAAALECERYLAHNTHK
jgi:thioredoxin reductase (NADPH)